MLEGGKMTKDNSDELTQDELEGKRMRTYNMMVLVAVYGCLAIGVGASIRGTLPVLGMCSIVSGVLAIFCLGFIIRHYARVKIRENSPFLREE